jgi:hypothetical protein
MRRTIGSLAIISTLVLGTGAAVADDTGLVGSLVALDVNTISADIYLQYHGRLLVKNSNGSLDEYRWGGTSCGTRLLPEADVAVLQRALNNKKMRIEPRSQLGQGDAKCLVGFTLVEKKNVQALP